MQQKNTRDDEAQPTFVKGRLPRDLHHQMKVLLAVNQETWEGWIQRKAREEVEAAQRQQR